MTELNFEERGPSGYDSPVAPKRLPKDIRKAIQATWGMDLDPNYGDSENSVWWLTLDDSVPYSREGDALIPIGTVIPGVLISDAYGGDRAHIRGAAKWASGRWYWRLYARGGLRPYPKPPYAVHQTHTSRGTSMSKHCRVHINEQGFTAQRGEVLLDAALSNGVDVPHDCRAGQCGTCKVKVTAGMTIGGECGEIGVVKACQARIITDLEVAVESVPEVLTTRGTVISTRPLAPDVTEVGIRVHDEIIYLPGQYYRFQFRGYPGRYFSPTAPMDRPFNGRTLRLHVRCIPDGRVSPAIGHEIQRGHPVTLNGPFGSAYFRPGLSNRLVLVGSGTGFAPIWSIADAAMEENSWREWC